MKRYVLGKKQHQKIVTDKEKMLGTINEERMIIGRLPLTFARIIVDTIGCCRPKELIKDLATLSPFT